MPKDPVELAEKAYDALFGLALPFLRRNRRLADGWKARVLAEPLPRADLWIQSASAGEAHLALEVIGRLGRACFGPAGDGDGVLPLPLKVLATATTRQGLDILARGARQAREADWRIETATAFFPLDRPRIMRRAVQAVAPKAVVLVEAEMWPGLLAALAGAHVPVLVVNGRMTTRSLARYLLWPDLWRRLAPALVQAISPKDAARFGLLFGPDRVAAAPNIKFDRLDPAGPPPRESNPLAPLVPQDTPFLVLASVREEEEDQAEAMVRAVLERRPGTVAGIFPRHMHRLAAWRARLAASGLPWTDRSRAAGPLAAGTVLLGDVFGELAPAFGLARAAFVGGSLAPLGGQNFLEALECGVVPVIGPHWKNFAWVGREVVTQGLVLEAGDAGQAAVLLVEALDRAEPREAVRARAEAFLSARRGGAEEACGHIAERLKAGYRP